MLTVLTRTLIIYLILMIVMRIMGKRQIGELEVSDLVTTILISEIASLPITNSTIPLSHAIVPTVILLTFEVTSSLLIAKYPKIKAVLTDRPTMLIKQGRFCKKAMLDARISNDELICEIRQQGITDPSEVLYAILEQNGKITVIPKIKYRTPNLSQLKLNEEETGLFHIIIDRGVVNKHAMNEFSQFKSKIEQYMKKNKLTPKDIYIMMIDDTGKIFIKKESDIQ